MLRSRVERKGEGEEASWPVGRGRYSKSNSIFFSGRRKGEISLLRKWWWLHGRVCVWCLCGEAKTELEWFWIFKGSIGQDAGRQ